VVVEVVDPPVERRPDCASITPVNANRITTTTKIFIMVRPAILSLFNV